MTDTTAETKAASNGTNEPETKVLHIEICLRYNKNQYSALHFFVLVCLDFVTQNAESDHPPVECIQCTRVCLQVSSPAPIFGAASTFGAGTGFGGFTGLVSKSETETNAAQDGGEDETAQEEECAAEFKPVVQLEEVEVSTGEEDETALFDFKCKLYRFDNDAGEWKERGVGQAKLLRHKEHNRVRFLMRQDKTLKIRGNHVVMPGTKVQEHSGSEKAVVFSCVDFANEVQQPELFCIRFASPERAQEFKKAYEAAAEENEKVLGISAPTGTTGDAEEGEEGEEKEKNVESAAAELEKKATLDEKEA